MNLKGFDFFRKVHSDIESSTLTGGIFSLLALIVNDLYISLEYIYFCKRYNISKIKRFIEIC